MAQKHLLWKSVKWPLLRGNDHAVLEIENGSHVREFYSGILGIFVLKYRENSHRQMEMWLSHTTAYFSILLLYSWPDSKAFNNCIVMSLVLMLKNLSEAVILFVLYNLLISTLWFPLRKSCSGFVLEMLSHIHTLSVEQFTLTVIAGPSESPDRSLSFFSFFYTGILTKKEEEERNSTLVLNLLHTKSQITACVFKPWDYFFSFLFFTEGFCVQNKRALDRSM